MMPRICFVLYVAALAAAVASAQTTAGNIITGNAKVDLISSYTGSEPLPKPQSVIIQDFALAGDVITDDSAAARLHRHLSLRRGSDEDSTPEVLTQQVQTSFSKTLIQEFAKVNVQSERAVDGMGAPTGSVLIVEGEFVAIDEGDKTKRVMIGFGRGASDIKTHVIVSSCVKGKKTTVLEFNLNSESGKRPGVIATMGTGSIAVGAAVGDIGDKKATVEADAARMAKAVAKQVEAFMNGKQWISATSQ